MVKVISAATELIRDVDKAIYWYRTNRSPIMDIASAAELVADGESRGGSRVCSHYFGSLGLTASASSFSQMRTSAGWRPREEVENGLSNSWHARLWRWSPDFFSVPLL
nr:hypothetical protein [Mesorhizobium sp.]